KGFLIGLFIMPALGLIVFTLIPRIVNGPSPPGRGDVAVIDRHGRVIEDLRTALTQSAISARAAAIARRGVGNPMRPAPQTDLKVVERPREAPLEQEKKWLAAGEPAEPHLALIVVHKDAVERAA